MNAPKKETHPVDSGVGVAKAAQPPRSAGRLSRGCLDLDSQVTAKAELDRMQRQYRILENQRKSLYEKSQVVLLKQRREIEILEKEKNELELNVGLAETENCKKRSKYQEEMSQLLQRQKLYSQAIDSEKTRSKQIDQQIVEVELEIDKRRKDILLILHNDGVETSNQKKIEILENRIAYASVQYNKLLSKNSSLRIEIDGLVKERSRFHALYRCLGKSLLKGKKEILALIEEAKAAYDQRDEIQMKLQALRRRDESDQAQHTNDIRNLRQTVEHEEKLQRFLSEKLKDRAEGTRKDWRMSTDLRDPVAMSQLSEKTVGVFREVFERLKAQHGEEDLDRLVELFVQKEEHNYSLFAYVNDITQDCERLQKEIEEARKRIADLRDMEKKRNVGYQQRLLDLQKSMEDAKKESADAESAAKTSSEAIEKLKSSILRLLELARVPHDDLVGFVNDGAEGMSEERALQLMSLLEQKASDITLAFSQLPYQKQEELDVEGKVPTQASQEKAEGSEGGDSLSAADVSGGPEKQCGVQQVSAERDHVKRRALGK